MATRPDTSKTVVLALELLRRIPPKRYVTAASLHAQLLGTSSERDLRTIQRQLETLSQHFDIEVDDRDKPYGYRWKEKSAGLAMHKLSEQDSLLLTLAQQYLSGLLPAKLLSSMEGFFDQARANLHQQSGAQQSLEWLSKVRVVREVQPLLPPPIQEGVFEAVSNALFANRWLELDYRNGAGKESHISVMPLGLAQQGPRLYLVCRYRGYDDERSLALHRIVSANVSTLGFERPPDFDLAKYDDEGRFGFGKGEFIRLRFQIKKSAGRHLLESPLSLDQEVIDLGEELAVSATVVDSAQLNWWLQSFDTRIHSIEKQPCPTPSGHQAA